MAIVIVRNVFYYYLCVYYTFAYTLEILILINFIYLIIKLQKESE